MGRKLEDLVAGGPRGEAEPGERGLSATPEPQGKKAGTFLTSPVLRRQRTWRCS